MNKSVVVFSGYNPRAVIAFIRTLESCGLSYAIIAKSEDDDILLTPYAKNVVAIREVPSLDLEDILVQIEKAKDKLGQSLLLAPSTEALNRFFLEHRERFEEAGCTIPLVEKSLYERISDKESFGNVCEDFGLDVPETYADFGSAKLPFVAKPKAYFASDGTTPSPVLVRTNQEKDAFVADYKLDDFYYQEFVSGDSQYLLYYFDKNGVVGKFSQKNLTQQPGGKSMTAAQASDLHNTPYSSQYERLLKELGFRGLVMIELKLQDDKAYMIEANPRFWGPSQLFVDAGVNLFESFLSDYGVLGAPTVNVTDNEAKYFWAGGLFGSSEVVYHEANEDDFCLGIDKWLASDIYKRPDTIKIFRKEMRL